MILRKNIDSTENDGRIRLMEVVDQGRTEIGEHMVECMNGDHTF